MGSSKPRGDRPQQERQQERQDGEVPPFWKQTKIKVEPISDDEEFLYGVKNKQSTFMSPYVAGVGTSPTDEASKKLPEPIPSSPDYSPFKFAHDNNNTSSSAGADAGATAAATNNNSSLRELNPFVSGAANVGPSSASVPAELLSIRQPLPPQTDLGPPSEVVESQKLELEDDDTNYDIDSLLKESQDLLW